MSKLSQTDVDNWWAILSLSRTKGAQNISMDFKNGPTKWSILLYLQTAHLFLYQSVIVGYCLHVIFEIRQKLDVPVRCLLSLSLCEDFKIAHQLSLKNCSCQLIREKKRRFQFLEDAVQHQPTYSNTREIRGLCLMKLHSKMLQNLPYFIYNKTQSCFFHFSFHASLFSLMNALVYVN